VNIYEAFDSSPQLIEPVMVFPIPKSTQQMQIKLEDFQKVVTNFFVNVNTDAVFQMPFPNRKTIFKYPSSDYLGELADPAPEISNSEPALKVAYGIIGAGILWMCFGWIFFQKRSNIELP
jgi:hypothetical protein